ncbi:MAG: hypothetical protein PF482_09205 [Desulfobacteraceae bacterium]|jgi:hypothetical protein|nr:hypothetical protein [Desulfobacteraceae bacterium]
MGHSKNKGGFFITREMYLSETYLSLNKNAFILLNAFLDARKRDMKNNSKKKNSGRKMPEFINLDSIEMPYDTLVKKYHINRSSIPRAMDELMAKGFIRLSYHGGDCKHDKNRYALLDEYLIWRPGMKPFYTRPKKNKKGYQGKRLGATATDEKFKCDYCGEYKGHTKKTNTGFNSCVECLADGAFNLLPEEINNRHAQNQTLTQAQN